MAQSRCGSAIASVAMSARDGDATAGGADERPALVVQGEVPEPQRGDDLLLRLQAACPAAALACRDPAQDACLADRDDDVEMAAAELGGDDGRGQVHRLR